MNNKITRRFIAGAVCPRCAELDKLTLTVTAQGEQIRECVRCGYRDVMSAEGVIEGAEESVIDEPATRVNQPRPGEGALAHEEEIQVVRLLDPLKDGRQRRDH